MLSIVSRSMTRLAVLLVLCRPALLSMLTAPASSLSMLVLLLSTVSQLTVLALLSILMLALLFLTATPVGGKCRDTVSNTFFCETELSAVVKRNKCGQLPAGTQAGRQNDCSPEQTVLSTSLYALHVLAGRLRHRRYDAGSFAANRCVESQSSQLEADNLQLYHKSFVSWHAQQLLEKTWCSACFWTDTPAHTHQSCQLRLNLPASLQSALLCVKNLTIDTSNAYQGLVSPNKVSSGPAHTSRSSSLRSHCCSCHASLSAARTNVLHVQCFVRKGCEAFKLPGNASVPQNDGSSSGNNRRHSLVRSLFAHISSLPA